jgi:MFS family permease
MIPPASGEVTTGPRIGSWAKGDKRFVALISLSHAVQHVYQGILPLTYPFIVTDFHISFATLGLVLGVSRFLGGILQGAAGVFSSTSTRALLGGQNVLLGVAAVGAGLAPTFPYFGAANIAGAVAGSPQHPVGSAALSQRFPQRLSTVLSWHNTGGGLGTALVPLLASAAIAAWGWRIALLLFGVPISLAGIALLGAMRGSAPVRAAAAPGPRVRLRQLLVRRGPILVIASGSVAAAGRGLGVLSVYVPSYLAKGAGLASLEVGAIVTVMAIGGLIGPIAMGTLADRFGRRGIITLSYLGGAVALGAFGLVMHSQLLLFIDAALVGLFAYAESPLLQSMFADQLPREAQQGAFGVYFMIAYGIGSLWVIALGAIIDSFGFSPAFLLMAAAFVAAAVMLTFVPRRRAGAE